MALHRVNFDLSDPIQHPSFLSLLRIDLALGKGKIKVKIKAIENDANDVLDHQVLFWKNRIYTPTRKIMLAYIFEGFR